MEQPLTSIIIPTYNDGLVVCEAIECALGQIYGNLEVIVVNDGSTDDTEHLLTRIYGDRITCVNQENRGAAGARNAGIKKASGKYLQFLDADDLLDPRKIAIQVEGLRSIPEKALSYCDYASCDMEMTKTYKRTSPVLQGVDHFEEIMLKWETEVSIPIHCFVFDARLFKEYGIYFDESLPANEDWECWMDLFALNPRVVYVDKVLAYYRLREGSRCRDDARMRLGWISAVAKQMEKNRCNTEVVQKLARKKRQMKYQYREASLLMRIMQKGHPVIREVYEKTMPWRIQRLFD